LISTNSSLQEELKKSQVSLLSFEEFRKGSEMATTKLKSQLKEREDLIQEQSATINGLTNQQKAEKASFELQMEEANKKMQNLQAEHERVAKDHDHQVTELRASITDAEDKLSKLRTQFEATSQILFQQNAQIDELQHRLDSVQVAAKNSEIQYQTLSQEHDTIQKTLAEALQNLQSHKEQLSSQVPSGNLPDANCSSKLCMKRPLTNSLKATILFYNNVNWRSKSKSPSFKLLLKNMKQHNKLLQLPFKTSI